MDVFTTDHPLTSQPSWFGTKEHPVLSAVCSGTVLALCFTPPILAGLYFYFISDIGAEPNPFPDPWFDLAVGSALSFIIAVLIAAALVTAYRLMARIWIKRDVLAFAVER